MGFEPIVRGPFATAPAVAPEPAGPPMPEPGWGDLFGASFESGNMVGSFFANEQRADPNAVEEGFKWDEGIADHPRYQSYADQFAVLNNSTARAELMAKIDREEENRRIRDAAPWWQAAITDITAGVLDLPTLIPGGALVKGAKGGYSITRSALMGSAAAGVGASVQEAGLQATQATRTAGESALTIGTGLVLGGLIGGGAAALLSPLERRGAEAAAARLMDSAIDGTPLPDVPVASGGMGDAVSAGAAAVDRPTREDLTIAGGAARAVAGATAKLTPNLRLNQNVSEVVRRYGQELLENPLYQEMHAEGRSVGASAETRMRVSMNSRLGDVAAEHDKIFKEYRKSGGKMSAAEFDEATGRAMANNDIGENDFISRSAAAHRAKLIEPFKMDAIDVRALPADVEVRTAPTYIMRLWDRNKLNASEGEAIETFKGYFRQKAKEIDRAMTFEAQKRIDKIEAEKVKRQAKGRQRISNLLAEIDDTEMGKVRRAENLRRQREGITEADMSNAGVTPADIGRLVTAVKAGSVKKPKVTSLTQWLASQGGLVDNAGELLRMGISNRTRPGFVRAARRTATNQRGGWDFDDAALRAWEEGYFPNHTERPSVREFLDALDGDFNGWGKVYRGADEAEAQQATALDELEEVMARLDVTDADLNFRAPQDAEALIEKVARAMDEADRQRVEKAQARIKEIEREISGGDYILSRTKQQQAVMRDRDRAAADLLDIDNEYEGFADEAARAVFNKLTGRAPDAEGVDIPDWIVPLTRGPLKERTFDIPDEMAEPFLNRNIRDVRHKYARTVASEVELVRSFGRADMRDQIAEITNHFTDLRMQVQSAPTLADARAIVGDQTTYWRDFKAWLREKRGGADADEVSKADITSFLVAQEEEALDDIKTTRDMLRGTDRPKHMGWDRVSRAIAAFNYLRLMGGAVIANMQEVFRPAMVHGLTPYFREAVAPMLSKAGREARRASVAEAKLAGQVLEGVLKERLYTIAEMGDRLAPNSPMERLLQNGTKIASRWNGLDLWTDVMKGTASVMSQNRIINGVLGEGDTRFLAYLGIDENMAGRIKAQAERFAEKRDGIWIANTEKWDDPSGALKRAYRAAVSKDVDSIVVTKGVGDLPLLARDPTWRLILQFRGFFFAAHQRVLLRGLQEDKQRFIGGLVAMTALGAAVSALRAMRGGEDRWEKWKDAATNPGYLIGEGLDMSGIFALPMEVGNTVEKITKFHPIKDPLKKAFPNASQQGSSVRFSSRGAAGALLGPTAGVIDLAAEVATRAEAAASGKTTPKQDEALLRKGAQMMPFYSYPGVRELTNLALDGTIPPF